jgi:hypothetical protein
MQMGFQFDSMNHHHLGEQQNNPKKKIGEQKERTIE